MSNHAVSANCVSSYAAGPGIRNLAAQSELAYSAGQAGDGRRPRPVRRALLPVAERVLDHPDTLAAAPAWPTGPGRRSARHRRTVRRAAPRGRASRHEHPDILINLQSGHLGYTGDAAAARDQFAALLPVGERVFGADSPDTLVAKV